MFWGFCVWRWNCWFPVWEGSHWISSSSLCFCPPDPVSCPFLHRPSLTVFIAYWSGSRIFFLFHQLSYILALFSRPDGDRYVLNCFNKIQSCTTDTSCCNNDHTFCVASRRPVTSRFSTHPARSRKRHAVIAFLSWDTVWFPVWRRQHVVKHRVW